MLDRDLARGLIQGGVGLDKDLTRLLVLQDNVADLGAPEVQADRCHVDVEIGARLHIGGGLVDVKLLEVLADG